MADTTNYRIRLEADSPAASSRLLALCGLLFFFPKVILIIPHAIVLWFVQMASFLVMWLGYWVVLFTGKYPPGMYNFVLGALRWQTRVTAWLFGLADEYPPFSMR